jgi:hypothetical protein
VHARRLSSFRGCLVPQVSYLRSEVDNLAIGFPLAEVARNKQPKHVQRTRPHRLITYLGSVVIKSTVIDWRREGQKSRRWEK